MKTTIGPHGPIAPAAARARAAESIRYRRTVPIRRPKLEGLTEFIDRWLEKDRRRPRKQRQTAKRNFDRLRTEYGLGGSYTG